MILGRSYDVKDNTAELGLGCTRAGNGVNQGQRVHLAVQGVFR